MKTISTLVLLCLLSTPLGTASKRVTMETISPLVLLCLLSTPLGTASERVTMERVVGGTADVPCSSKPEQRESPKNFYKMKSEDEDEDRVVLLDSLMNESSSTEKYKVHDKLQKEVFMVSITNLSLEDAGTYGCGVNRLSDHVLVTLRVDKAPRWPTRSIHHFCTTVIISVCLSMLFLLILFLVYKHKSSGVVFTPNAQTSSKPHTPTENDGKYYENNPFSNAVVADTLSEYQTLQAAVVDPDMVYQSLDPEEDFQGSVYQVMPLEEDSQAGLYQTLQDIV